MARREGCILTVRRDGGCGTAQYKWEARSGRKWIVDRLRRGACDDASATEEGRAPPWRSVEVGNPGCDGSSMSKPDPRQKRG